MPLGEICEILDKLRKPITKKDRIAGDVPYYGATGIVDYVADYIFDEKLVLIGEDGAKWKAGDNSAFPIYGKTWVNNHAHVIRPIPSVVLDEWLIYFLNFSDLMQYITGVTVPKLNQGKLRSIPIPIPPLEEQKRIVAILDTAFEGLDRARAHTEANLQNAKDLFRSALNSAVTEFDSTWNEYRFGDLINFLNGFAFKSKDAIPNSNTQLVRMGNLYQNALDLERKPSFYPDRFADEYSRFEIFEGDIILSLTGTVGKKDYGYAVRVPTQTKRLLLNQRIAKFIDVDESTLHKSYLMMFLHSEYFLEPLYDSANGTRQANLSTKEIKDFVFSFPPIEQQASLVSILESLKSSCSAMELKYKTKLTDIDDLRQSLLQKAFAGELT